jgi:hypothetical protein
MIAAIRRPAFAIPCIADPAGHRDPAYGAPASALRH